MRRSNSKKKRRWGFFVVLILLVGLAATAGLDAIRIVSEYKKEENASEQLRQFIDLAATQPAQPTTQEPTSPTEGTEITESAGNTPEETKPVSYPVVDFEALLAVNDDVVGWIYIPDTNVNYPVVQGTDNRHYAFTMADGRDNAAGSIFMDYRNTPDFSDKHTVIYGHNMRNGSMFANIVEYKQPEYLAEHPFGMILTPDGNFQFEVIGGYVAELSDPAWQLEFAGEEDFLLWLEEAMVRIGIDGGIQPEDRILTLSTCSYEFSEARYVLVCRVLE